MDPGRLKSIPLFADLSDAERERIGRWADEVEVPEGKHLVDEGKYAYEFFVIEEGTAAVRHGDDVVAELGPGDFFGEIALIESIRRTASVVATSPMRAVVMFGRDFRSMENEMPAVADRIKRAVEDRKGS
ncbi:MAG TPA: cyclic nucleotide-binding domain-containing protein [Actinomycetota bacterium]|nr:cyclic nucleotide-binding domain-containing protein [Actinomycetota bacterium]